MPLILKNEERVAPLLNIYQFTIENAGAGCHFARSLILWCCPFERSDLSMPVIYIVSHGYGRVPLAVSQRSE
jgi:hypothetical protein